MDADVYVMPSCILTPEKFSRYALQSNITAVTALKPRSHCVRRCTSTQDTADAKLYATYRCCQWAQLRCRTCGMLRPSAYDDAVCINAAVRDYNVAVRQ